MENNKEAHLRLVNSNFSLDGSNNDTINPKSSDGGNGNMPSKYATKEELNHVSDNLSNEIKLLDKNIDNKFEKLNTKFAEQKVWFFGTAISVVALTCTIVGLLIKFIK